MNQASVGRRNLEGHAGDGNDYGTIRSVFDYSLDSLKDIADMTIDIECQDVYAFTVNRDQLIKQMTDYVINV